MSITRTMSMDYQAAPNNRLELVDLVDNGGSGNGVLLEEHEKTLFKAVEQGDLEQVKLMLNQDSRPLNINAINSDGLTPLQVAVENKQLDIVKELLEKGEGADVKTALLQCVLENDLQCVQILLTKKADVGMKQTDSYITPIILAAQLGHYEMVNLLMKNDQSIDEPCESSCACEDCATKSNILRSQIAINSFRGLSSPDYMCLQYLMAKRGQKDPLTQAFELNTKLERRANEEPELSKEYLNLSERCKRFGVDLYNECRSTKEITALLNIDEQDFNLSSGTKVKTKSRANVTKTFRSAIESDHKEFIAHPHTQQLLNTVVYSGFPAWRSRSFFYKLFVYAVITIFFPIFAVIYLVYPHHRISRLMSTPFIKFVTHTTQFIVFLALLVATSLRDNHLPSALEYLTFLFVLGMIAQEMKEMLRCKPRLSYFFKWWNVITTLMLTLFVLAALLWVIGYAITGGWSVVEFSKLQFKTTTGHHLLLLGNSFFSMAIVVSVFHLIDLCQVNSVLGPLQLSLYRMLRDVFKFLLIFFAIFVAFVMGIRNLYSYYNSVQHEISSYYAKQNVTGHENIADHELSSLTDSTRSMFWALFDKIDLEDFDTKDTRFEITQETGKVLFAFYSICAVMVALNMLIAMMTHSYETISQDDDVQWKFSRTQLWLEFVEKGSNLPSPYNLIPNPTVIYRIGKRIILSHSLTAEQYSRTVDDKSNEKQTERKNIIKRLVRRYFLKRECQRKKELSTLEDIENCKSEIIRVLRENDETGSKE